jgi:hypothetical protein
LPDVLRLHHSIQSYGTLLHWLHRESDATQEQMRLYFE